MAAKDGLTGPSASLTRPDSGVFCARVTHAGDSTIRLRYGIEAWFAPKEQALELEKRLRRVGVATLMVSDSGRAALRAIERKSEVAPCGQPAPAQHSSEQPSKRVVGTAAFRQKAPSEALSDVRPVTPCFRIGNTSSSSTRSWRMICWLWVTSSLASSPARRWRAPPIVKPCSYRRLRIWRISYILALVITAVTAAFERLQGWELLFPVAQYMRLDAAQIAYLTNGEVTLPRDCG